MNTHAPVTGQEVAVQKLGVKCPDANSEPDPDMLEIEEARRHFENQSDPEAYWAGRLLADRKSTRIAA